MPRLALLYRCRFTLCSFDRITEDMKMFRFLITVYQIAACLSNDAHKGFARRTDAAVLLTKCVKVW